MRRSVARGGPVGPRQEQILRLAALGDTDKEIAAALGIAVPTVRTHLDRFFRDHGVRNRTEAVAVWIRATADSQVALGAFQLSFKESREMTVDADHMLS